MIQRRRFVLAAAAVTVLPFTAGANAYPALPVHAIVSNAPGTGTNITARYLATQMSRKWGQSVVVENKVGAGGVLGSDFVAKAAPDGYTVLFSTGAHFSLPSLSITSCMVLNDESAGTNTTMGACAIDATGMKPALASKFGLL